MVTVDTVKERVLEALERGNLLEYVDFESSIFGTLPRFFEVSHFDMKLCLNRLTKAHAIQSIVAKLKRELEQEGIELEFTVAAERGISTKTSGRRECEEPELVLKA